MAVLRLQHEADCLSSHRTERSLRPHPISRPRSGATLPRERFSPTTPSGLWDLSIAAAQNRNSGHCTLSHPGTNDCGRSTSIHPAKPRLYRGTARSVCGCRHNTALQIASYKLTRRKKRPTPHRRAGRLNNASIKGASIVLAFDALPFRLERFISGVRGGDELRATEALNLTTGRS